MHDRSLMDALMRKIQAISREHGGARVAAVRVRLGAIAAMDRGHFLEHWAEASRGGVAEGAAVAVEESEEPFGVLLVDVELDA